MVFGGTLFANNTAGSATSTGAVTIALDATLAGNGTVAGPVNNVFGGTVAPGSSNNIGRLTLLNGVDMSGGTNAWELGADKDNNTGVAGVDFDQLSITGGTLNLGGSSTLLLQFSGTSTFPSSTNSFWQSSHTWKVVALSGGATNSGSANANFSAIAGTNDITSGTFSTTVDPGTGSILLSWAPAGGTSNPPVIEGNISGAGTTNATIRWSASSGNTYEVQYKDHLTDPTWSILGTTTATGSTASITDTNNPPAPVRFYRVLVQ